MIYKRHAMCNIGAGQVHSTEDRSNYLCCVYTIYICRHSHSAVGQSQCIAPSLTLFLLFSSPPLFFLFFIEENWTKRSSSICSVLYLYLQTHIYIYRKKSTVYILVIVDRDLFDPWRKTHFHSWKTSQQNRNIFFFQIFSRRRQCLPLALNF